MHCFISKSTFFIKCSYMWTKGLYKCVCCFRVLNCCYLQKLKSSSIQLIYAFRPSRTYFIRNTGPGSDGCSRHFRHCLTSSRKTTKFKWNTIAKVQQKTCIALLQPLWWCCVECVIHHERDVREEQKYVYVARTSNNRVVSSGDLYCCLLPRCEALRTCLSGFPIATV